MHGLEKGVHLLATQETNQKIRNNAIDLLNGVIDDLKSGIEVWNKLVKSGGHSTKPGSFGGWAGFEMDNTLWELELQARDKARQASNGGSSLDEPLISQSNVKLDEGQGDLDCAQQAISAMEDRTKRIKSLIDAIKKTKPKKPAAAKTKAASKKVPTKKKSTQKKAAAKKPAKKKPVKKKASKKKVAKKKAPTKKKAAKKQATKKKVAKKKATKKKAAKKKAVKKAPTKKKKAKKR